MKSTILRGTPPPAPCDRRYVVVFSDDDSRWTIVMGEMVWSVHNYLDWERCQAVRFAPNPRLAIKDLPAPKGRVFRVTDIDSGDLQEFVVEHVRVNA